MEIKRSHIKGIFSDKSPTQQISIQLGYLMKIILISDNQAALMRKNPKENEVAQERSLSTRKITNRFTVTKERNNSIADAIIMTCFGQAH